MERMTTSVTAIAFERVVKHYRFFASPLNRLKEACAGGGAGLANQIDGFSKYDGGVA